MMYIYTLVEAEQQSILVDSRMYLVNAGSDCLLVGVMSPKRVVVVSRHVLARSCAAAVAATGAPAAIRSRTETAPSLSRAVETQQQSPLSRAAGMIFHDKRPLRVSRSSLSLRLKPRERIQNTRTQTHKAPRSRNEASGPAADPLIGQIGTISGDRRGTTLQQ